jgi:hypothetical protein
MQLAICQICKYPVWSYICPDCLAKEIGGWLPRGLSVEFRKFSRSLLRHFSSVESNLTQVRCIRCRQKKEATLCSFCYIAEAFAWLHERSSRLAKTLFMALPADLGAGVSSGLRPWKEIKPISYEEGLAGEGICEECGEFSETKMADGRWVCESCTD